MEIKPRTREEIYGPALAKAVRDLQALDPWLAAVRSGVTYRWFTATTGQFEVKFWGKDYLVNYPQIAVQEAKSGQEPSIVVQIIILHYLIHADGTPPANYWVSFHELPGGRAYYPAFQARANSRLARAFGNDLEGFVAAAEALGGERLTYGDASFLFRILPRLWMAVVLHLADEEFPPSANVLFDATAANYLPMEDLAVLGGMLTNQLLKKRASMQTES